MAAFFLINTVRLGTNKHFAGEPIDDRWHDVNALRNAGAVLVTSTPGLAAASLRAASARNAGADEGDIESIMQVAVLIEAVVEPLPLATASTYRASGALSGHRVVKALAGGYVGYCDAFTLSDSGLLVGISIQAASDGQPIQVQQSGTIVEPSWAWMPGEAVYCGEAGVLTQTHDRAWAWACIVGVAIDATSILMRLDVVVVQH